MAQRSDSERVGAPHAPTTRPPPGHPRFPHLDGLRAIAALLIFGYDVASVSGSLKYGWTSDFTVALQAGAPIFFALSGFLLYRPMLAHRHGAAGRPLRAYARSRALRILPAYWVALTAAAIYPSLHGVFTGDWWWYYGLLQTYSHKHEFSGLPVAWSLCVQLSFYALLPVYAVLMDRLAGTGRRWIRVELAVLGALALASAAAFVHFSILSLVVTFAWFAVGMAAAVVSVAGRGPRRTTRWPSLMWPLAIVAGVAYGLVLGPRDVLHLGPAAARAAHVLLLTAIAALVLPAAIWGARTFAQRVLSWRWLAGLGAISFGVYLYHVPVLLSLQRSGLDDLVHARPVLSYVLVGLPLTVALATLSYHLVERPALSLRSASTPARGPGDRLRRRSRRVLRVSQWRDWVTSGGETSPRLKPAQVLAAACVITVASVLLYARAVSDLGFYYDDWLLQSAFGDAASGSIGDLFAACRDVEPAGRPGGCVYHSGIYALLGADPAAYHVLSIVLLVGSTLLIYLLLRRCRLPHWPALLVCVLYVVYPGSDVTRLWPTSIGAQYILGAYVGGVLLAIEAMRRRGRRRALCHAASGALWLLLVFTYEVVIPLIAVSAAFYLLAIADRRAALKRGFADFAFAMVFVAYRLLIEPVDPASGFVPKRTIEQSLAHLSRVLDGAWSSWHTLFLPSPAAVAASVVALAVVVAAAARAGEVRRSVLTWFAVAAGAAAFAVLSVLPFVAANDLYVPDTYSLFNRLNIASAPAYCLLFAALAGALWTALRSWLPQTAATAIAGVLVALVVVSQVDVERRSQGAWAASWDAQETAIAGLRRAQDALPSNATVMSFGHPLWERGFIPVFSAGWDLRGAIDEKTRVDPPRALPFMDTATCGAGATQVAGVPFARYVGARSQLWFVDTRTGAARRITSRRACDATVAEWGRPPFWGVTVTGPA